MPDQRVGGVVALNRGARASTEFIVVGHERILWAGAAGAFSRVVTHGRVQLGNQPSQPVRDCFWCQQRLVGFRGGKHLHQVRVKTGIHLSVNVGAQLRNGGINTGKACDIQQACGVLNLA